MDDINSKTFRVANQRGRRRRAACGHSHGLIQPKGPRRRMVQQGGQHSRSPAEICYSVFPETLQHLFRFGLPKAYVSRTHGGHTPGKAPAVAVKHRDDPKIIAAVLHLEKFCHTERIQVGSAVRIHDPFWFPRSPTRIIDRNNLVFIFELIIRKRVTTLRKEVFVIFTFESAVRLRIVHNNESFCKFQL